MVNGRPKLQESGRRPQVGRPAKDEKKVFREYQAHLKAQVIKLHYTGRNTYTIADELNVHQWWVSAVIRQYNKKLALTLAANVRKPLVRKEDQ